MAAAIFASIWDCQTEEICCDMITLYVPANRQNRTLFYNNPLQLKSLLHSKTIIVGNFKLHLQNQQQEPVQTEWIDWLHS
jgi:hypothetical protein